MGQYIYGRNTIRSALKNDKIAKIFIQSNSQDFSIVKECQKKDVPIQFVSSHELDEMVHGVHQGVVAIIKQDYAFVSLDELLHKTKKHEHPLLIMLDGINDPHNLGAILRSADSFGADGIIVGKHNQVGLTATVAKVSTGAIDYVPVAQVGNLNQAIRQLKKEGFWIVSSDGTATLDYRQVDYKMPMVLIIGSEGEGVSKLVLENSDFIVRIPMCGSVNSLNASVATAVLLAEIYNNRFPL